jgi:5-formyltetrahydrofolate cyclo-ligase
MFKEKIRQNTLSLIRQIPADIRRQRDDSVSLCLAQLAQTYDQVAAYVPMKHEIVLKLSVDRLFLPHLMGEEMRFETTQGDPLDLSLKTLMLVPGIAFNRQGFRVGMGKGFFDRYLASKPTIDTIGVLYKEQLMDFQPMTHDVPLKKLYVVNDQAVNIIHI